MTAKIPLSMNLIVSFKIHHSFKILSVFRSPKKYFCILEIFRNLQYYHLYFQVLFTFQLIKIYFSLYLTYSPFCPTTHPCLLCSRSLFSKLECVYRDWLKSFPSYFLDMLLENWHLWQYAEVILGVQMLLRPWVVDSSRPVFRI